MEPHPHRISRKCYWDDEEHIAYSIHHYTIHHTAYSTECHHSTSGARIVDMGEWTNKHIAFAIDRKRPIVSGTKWSNETEHTTQTKWVKWKASIQLALHFEILAWYWGKRKILYACTLKLIVHNRICTYSVYSLILVTMLLLL